jgi:hypothetical protein
MRPNLGGEAAGPSGSRKSSCADTNAPVNLANAPTTFFMAREEDILGGGERTERRSSHGSARGLDSVYGVQSLEESLAQAFPDKNAGQVDDGMLKRKRRKASWTSNTEDKGNNSSQLEDKAIQSEESTRHSPPQDLNPHHFRRPSRAATISQPLTPLQFESPFPLSAMPSTPKSGSFRSLRLSDEEESIGDNMSQAITSGGEEDEEDSDGRAMLDMSGVAPELVMPSLSMPSRRPFTAKGKLMGRLKVCVAGSNGKITSFLQTSPVKEDSNLLQELVKPVLSEPSSSNAKILSIWTH